MANIASQIKRNKTNEKARRRNHSIRSEMKTRTRRALEAAEAGDADEAASRLRDAQQRIDTAVVKGVLHKRTAARRKSRLARQVADLLDA
jgi:small subunit ribosomal protein S20